MSKSNVYIGSLQYNKICVDVHPVLLQCLGRIEKMTRRCGLKADQDMT